jgi:hypothetical protein
MDQNPENRSDSGVDLDRVLSKYITIWVWSILVGVNTSMTFSLINANIRSRGTEVFLLLGPVYLIASASTLVSWYFVVKYLRFFIVPKFFWSNPGPMEHDPRAWGSIRSIGSWMLLAIALRLLLAGIDLVFSSGIDLGFRFPFPG